MDGFGRAVAFILAGILIFLLPLRYILINYQTYVEHHVQGHTKEFAADVMDKGYLTLDMYQKYVEVLNPSKELYHIELIHSVPTEGITKKDYNLFQSRFHMTGLNTNMGQMVQTSYDILPMKERESETKEVDEEETKESDEDEREDEEEKVPVSLKVTPSEYVVRNGEEPAYFIYLHFDDGSAELITEDYTKTGFTPGAGMKEVVFRYETQDYVFTDTIIIEVVRNSKTCENNHNYELDDFDNDFGCPTCTATIYRIEVFPVSLTIERGKDIEAFLTITYLDGHKEVIQEGFSHDFNSSIVGEQEVTFSYKNHSVQVTVFVVENYNCSICGRIYSSDEKGEDKGCPICNNKVLEISIEPNFYIVPLGEELILEVTATYLSGKSEKVTGWTSNFNGNKPGLQQVMVFYENVVTSIQVFVESETDTICPNCNSIYSKIEYPNECPFCSRIVMGIELNLNNGEKVKLGSELNLSVTLLYFNGYRELAKDGWEITGYQSNVLGKQNILVTYGEYETSLWIEVVEHLNSNICEEGHDYFLEPGGEDPGCPYCNNPDHTTELTSTYMDGFYTNDILDELYTNGVYYFKDGDYLTITISIHNNAFPWFMNDLFLLTIKNFKYTYGGTIHGKFF